MVGNLTRYRLRDEMLDLMRMAPGVDEPRVDLIRGRHILAVEHLSHTLMEEQVRARIEITTRGCDRQIGVLKRNARRRAQSHSQLFRDRAAALHRTLARDRGVQERDAC